MFRYNKALAGKILLVFVLLAAVLAVSGCTRLSALQGGWSGAALADGHLFFGSAGGQLIALNTADGSQLWPPYSLESSSSSGGGCAAPAQTSIYGTPTVDGDLVYIGGFNGKVYAINTSTGALRWVYPREGALHPIVGGPVVAQGRIYLGATDGGVYALDATTGDKVWQFETGGELWSAPAISGDTVIVTSFNKKVYALDAATGNEKWAQPFEAEGPIVATPLIYDNTVYIASLDRHIYALDATSGQQLWTFPSDKVEGGPQKWFWATPVVYQNTIYAADMDGRVYVLDAGSGALVTFIDLGGAISSSPVVVNGRVIVASEEGKVYSIDTQNNQSTELKAIDGIITAPLAASGDAVYVHVLKDETIYALNAETGAVIWSIPIS